MKQRVEATVYGFVQGVSFRYYTRREAERLQLTGWVANRADGAVLVVAEGTADALQQLVHFLHRGSPASRVTKLETAWLPATGEFTNFAVRWL